jgi:hypothetical protein
MGGRALQQHCNSTGIDSMYHGRSRTATALQQHWHRLDVSWAVVHCKSTALEEPGGSVCVGSGTRVTAPALFGPLATLRLTFMLQSLLLVSGVWNADAQLPGVKIIQSRECIQIMEKDTVQYTYNDDTNFRNNYMQASGG